MVTWGFRDGFKTGNLTPVQAAQRAKELGYMWWALELDDYGNDVRWGPFKEASQFVGLRYGPWFTHGGNVVNTPADAQFTIAEIESEEDRQGVINAPVPNIPHWVVTNFTPMTDAQGRPLPDKAAPIIERGYGCMPEAYVGETNNPDEMVNRAVNQLGWPVAYPVFGIHTTPNYDAYKPKYPKRADWSAEYIL